MLCAVFAVALGSAGYPGAVAQTAPPAAQRPLRIAFVGDLLPEAHWRQPPVPPAQLLEKVRAVLSAADLVVGNLEEPLTDWPQTTPHKNPQAVAAGRDFILRATSPEVAPALRAGGLRVAALANNHTMDYAERGLLDTLERLGAADILTVGAGKDLAEAEQARVVEVGGVRVGFLSFSDVVPPGFEAAENRPGIASSKDVARLRAAVAQARPHADFLAVIFHWGQQLAREPTLRQRALAREAQRAGADLVLGAHPHVLQGIGCLGRVPVVYSAGNFLFPTQRRAPQRSAVFEIEVGRSSGVSVRVVPVLLDSDGVPHPAEGAEARRILDEVGQLSARLQASPANGGASFSGDTATCSETPPEKPVPPARRRNPQASEPRPR